MTASFSSAVHSVPGSRRRSVAPFRMAPETPRYALLPVPWGTLGVLGTARGLIRIDLRPDSEQTLKSGITRQFGKIPVNDPLFFRDLSAQLERFFAGLSTSFRVRTNLNGLTFFQEKVLHSLRGVPFGQTVSYAELARRAGFPRAARAVGNVCSRNPLPLVIPCHRVVSSDGALGGYSGGLDLKRRLLSIEGHPC